MEYGMTIRTAAPFADVAPRVRAALKDQGFGVLTEIDVRATMRDKLGEDMEDYLILGACNPPLAHRALTADRKIGLLLPCNVVIRAEEHGTVVEALDPRVIATMASQPEVKAVADEAAHRLLAALQAVRDDRPPRGMPDQINVRRGPDGDR